ncbi:MAG TPA: NUDIX domain-containing protein [Patescibacteria group bacterium]|nr:NUDIX domain-containing protein [Patescibacteria group bacterium]
MKNNTIYKSGGILIKDKKLLVERSKNKEFFISPGGSIEDGETPTQALARELWEEFKINVVEDNFEEFGVFSAQAVGQEDRKIQMNVYIVKSWQGEPTPSSEVEEILWINSNIPDGIKVGSIFEHDVIPKLKELNLID